MKNGKELRELAREIDGLQIAILPGVRQACAGHDVRLIIMALLGTAASVAINTNMPRETFTGLTHDTIDSIAATWGQWGGAAND